MTPSIPITSYEEYLDIPTFIRNRAKAQAKQVNQEVEDYNARYAHPDDADWDYPREYQPTAWGE